MLYYADMTRCLDADPETKKVFVNKCDAQNPNQQWSWGFVNKTLIDGWDTDENFMKKRVQ
jgi:hypothetical protein